MGEPAIEPNAAHELREGALVADKYRLVSLAGAGAMGEVWRARHAQLGHGVAIKFLLGHARDSEEAQLRFDREARLAAQLGEASPHVARVVDCGRLPDGTPFLVMELLRGEELAQKLKREVRLSIEETARIVRQLCRALATAHAAGVVHRDVKPANVFLCATDDRARSHVKLMDFGVAKSFDGDIETTRAGTVIGTPAYMSPEQVLAKNIDARSDLWGVGATVYRMITGATPFGNGAYAELGVRILSSPPIPATTLVPGLPEAFDAWIDKALAKDPHARFQSAEELADALALVAGLEEEPLPLRARVVRALKEAPTLSPPLAESANVIALERTSQTRPSARSGVRAAPRRRSRAPLVVLIAAMIGAVVILRTRGIAIPFFSSDGAKSQSLDVAKPAENEAPAIPPAPAPTPAAVPASATATASASASASASSSKTFAAPPPFTKKVRPL